MTRMMTKALSVCVGLGALGGAALASAPAVESVEAAPFSADWTLKDGSGKTHRLSDYRGQIVMLDFWATWCGPCKAAMPSIDKLAKDYSDKGVVVFGANCWERAGGAAADRYMKQQGFSYVNLHNADDLAQQYGVRGIPTFIVFGVDGEKIFQRSGFGQDTKRELTQFLDDYIAKNKSKIKVGGGGDDSAAAAPKAKPEQWTLRDGKGKTHKLSDYKGKAVILDFWATWCGPCKRAMPSVQALHEKYADRGLVVFGANTWERAGGKKADEYMKDQGFTYVNLHNADDLADKYNVEGIPTFIVFGADGTIVHRATGFSEKTERELERFLDGYLKENVKPAKNAASQGSSENWTLKDGSGKSHSLNDFQGKVVLVDFWATWCGPCKRAMPSLQALHEELKDEGLVVIGANTWERAGGDASDKYMRQQGFTYTNLHDADELAKRYGVRGIPTFIVFGTNGEKLWQASGFSEQNKKRLREVIEANLPGS